jgi:DNA-binding response OmpR family regulator
MSGDRAKAMVAGCDDYIEKPINPDTFVTLVEAAGLSGRRQEEARE